MGGLLGKNHGDFIKVSLNKDTEPKVVEVPEYLEEKLAEYQLKETFMKKSYSQQRKFVEAIVNVKKVKTRNKRIKDLIGYLESF